LFHNLYQKFYEHSIVVVEVQKLSNFEL
jgi:hypothetical protein